MKDARRGLIPSLHSVREDENADETVLREVSLPEKAACVAPLGVS